jgi:hypothetical protein
LGPLLTRLFPEAAEGAAKGAASGVAATEATAAKAAAASARKAEELALRKEALALKARQVADREARTALLRERLSGKAPLARTTPKTAQPTEPIAAPAATREATAPDLALSPAAAAPSAAVADDTASIVLKLQQQMGTQSGRKVVRELLEQMPKDQAAQIKALLFRGQAHPATTLGALFDPTKSEVGRVARPGEELARLLGQIQ